MNETTKYKIRPNSVEETLIIPLYARLIAEENYPSLKGKGDTRRIVESLDYDFSSFRKKMSGAIGTYGAIEAIQREYDLGCEVREYLKDHPKASVVNLGCGLLDILSEIDVPGCRCYNIDYPNVIEIRNNLMPPRENETNLGFDLNDYRWMERIDREDGVVFIAAGVFYYFKREDAIKLFRQLSFVFPSSALAFDTCNKLGLRMMLKTYIKQAGIKDVGTYFGLSNPIKELNQANLPNKGIHVKSYMHGYRKLHYRPLHKVFNLLMGKVVKGRIVRIDF